MRPYTRTIAAGAADFLHASGTFFKVKVITAGASVTVSTPDGLEIECAAGEGFKGAEFDQLRLENRGGSVLTVVLLVGRAEFISDAMSGTLATIPQTPTGAVTLPDVEAPAVAGEIRAAGDRVEVIAQAHPDNTENIRIGFAGTGAAAGFVLMPGSLVVFTTAAALHAYCPTPGQMVCLSTVSRG